MPNKDKYEKIFCSSFGLKKTDLKKDIKYNSVSKWDSVGHMAMIAKLEEAFKITMEMDDIIDFSSFKKGKELLKKYDIVI